MRKNTKRGWWFLVCYIATRKEVFFLNGNCNSHDSCAPFGLENKHEKRWGTGIAITEVTSVADWNHIQFTILLLALAPQTSSLVLSDKVLALLLLRADVTANLDGRNAYD